MTAWITPETHLSAITGQPTSAEVRSKLKKWTEDKSQPIFLSYSLGKDAIATALALKEDEIPFIPVFFYLIPDLNFVNKTIETQQAILGERIRQYPHPSIYRWLNSFTFQPPERCEVIELAGFAELDYKDMWEIVKEDHQLPQNTWVADGVRAPDSIVRRTSFIRHGVMKANSRKVSPIADWRINAVREIMRRHNFPLPIDYKWFGRSFDGLDARFIGPLAENSPEDYQRLLEWFPLAEMELHRRNKQKATK